MVDILLYIKAQKSSFRYIYKEVPQHESHQRRKYEVAALKMHYGDNCVQAG